MMVSESQRLITEDIIALRISKLMNSIVKIVEEFERKEGKESKTLPALRTRARQLYEALTYHGLYQVIAYCAGKALYQNLLNVYNALSARDFESLKNELTKALSNIKEAEDRAYALYGGILLQVLSDLCNLKVSENLDELISNLITNQYLEQVAYMIAKWIKLCAEALIRKER